MALDYPLLKRELIGLLRTRRAFWLALVLVALSTLIPLMAWPSGQRVSSSRDHLEVFLAFAMTQLTVVLLITPAFTAAAFSGEREAGTLEMLYTTLLSPISLVVSKFLSSTCYILIILIATGPSLCVLVLLGGIPLELVLINYLATIAAVVMTGRNCR